MTENREPESVANEPQNIEGKENFVIQNYFPQVTSLARFDIRYPKWGKLMAGC